MNLLAVLESVDSQQRQLQVKQINKVTNKIQSRYKDKQDTNENMKPSKPTRVQVLKLTRTTHCLRCGNMKHREEEECPATNKECTACGGRNHLARACLKAGNAIVTRGKQLYNVYSSKSSASSGSDIDQIRTIEKGSKVIISVELNKQPISMLYDPGAACSIIGERMWKNIGSPTLSPCKDLTAYTGINIETLGRTTVSVNAFGYCKKLQVTVVKNKKISLFLVWIGF